jgi:hypothetical protein
VKKRLHLDPIKGALIEPKKTSVAAQTDGLGQSIKVCVGDEVREIKAGERYTFDV